MKLFLLDVNVLIALGQIIHFINALWPASRDVNGAGGDVSPVFASYEQGVLAELW